MTASAFPRRHDQYPNPGVTQRQYYATRALIGILAGANNHNNPADIVTRTALSFTYADELIKQGGEPK